MLTCSKNLKLKLYTVPDDQFPKRRHTASRSLKLSSRKKKLQDDYDIFQYLKNENTTDNYMTSLTDRKENSQLHYNNTSEVRVSNLFEKDKGFLKKFNDVQSKRKQEQLLKADYLLKKDLADLNKIAQNSVQSFSSHFSLYNHFHFEHLLEPQTTRPDLQLPPKQTFSILSNPNKRDRTYKVPLHQPFISQDKIINEQSLEKVRFLNQKMNRMSLNLITKLDPLSEQYFQQIQDGNVDELKKLIKKYPHLLQQRTRLQETGLHVAVKRNKNQVVELLLNNQIDEFARNIWGQTSRQLAFKLQYRNILKMLTYDQNQ
ncbi:unnamed protein product (macronuclear) [Paramecium tetraurelia]|uniref:Uncharacterized protein n=1 Tax=Paramecium tetraurelia TaxID=5888 RepID=A0DVB5_PARTE|nr:uncharacterized protein GSPATT00020646001 [Paramecium tetraurelia]CAK86982.1 unnamed protein product [Paramecium tetraurelia]|eukprot:XP_001454379.1 hypothetical protein (macronuclear) [Paramecium tetraurelia strain d4-2]